MEAGQPSNDNMKFEGVISSIVVDARNLNNEDDSQL